MLTASTARKGRSVSVAVILALFMGATSYAAKGLVQDRRITLEQAQTMTLKAQSRSEFPVVMNDLVLKELNQLLGTSDGREFMKAALERMERHRTSIESYIKKYNMPPELMAIPIIESGYKNLPERANSTVNSAGMWQFIRSTARNYGLKVDNHQDERMDVGLNTDAAMRYLQANYLRFKDWHLSVLAYNVGERTVQNAMDEHSTRDAWELSRNMRGSGSFYLPRLMAAIIIMNNPDSVE
jgi:membrane-bound lytic murein transglycosylase D